MRIMNAHVRIMNAGVALLTVTSAVTACIPYTVGTTSQPVPVGERAISAMSYAMPSIDLDTANTGGSTTRPRSSQLVVDIETRWGVDDRSDVGLRSVGFFSGLVINYKRMLTDSASRVRVAIMPGLGIVNGGNHGYAEFTLIASGQEPRDVVRGAMHFVPYGGFRAMQVVPTDPAGVRDRLTAGGFLGLRIGSRDFGISPELGVFHDHSALGVRKTDIVFVPSITVHGNELMALILGRPRSRARERGPAGSARLDPRHHGEGAS